MKVNLRESKGDRLCQKKRYKGLRKMPGTAALGGKNDQPADHHVMIMKTK